MTKDKQKLKLQGLKIYKPIFIYKDKKIKSENGPDILLHTTICILRYKAPYKLRKLTKNLSEGYTNTPAYHSLIDFQYNRAAVAKGVTKCNPKDIYKKEIGEKVSLYKAKINLYYKLEGLYCHLSKAYNNIVEDLIIDGYLIQKLYEENIDNVININD